MSNNSKSATLPANLRHRTQPTASTDTDNGNFFTRLKKRFRLRKGHYDVGVNTGECENVSVVSFKKKTPEAGIADNTTGFPDTDQPTHDQSLESPKTTRPIRSHSERYPPNIGAKHKGSSKFPNLDFTRDAPKSKSTRDKTDLEKHQQKINIAHLTDQQVALQGNTYSFIKYDKEPNEKPLEIDKETDFTNVCLAVDDSAVDLDSTNEVSTDELDHAFQLSCEPGYESISDVKKRIDKGEFKSNISTDSADRAEDQEQKIPDVTEIFPDIEPGYEAINDVKKRIVDKDFKSDSPNKAETETNAGEARKTFASSESSSCHDIYAQSTKRTIQNKTLSLQDSVRHNEFIDSALSLSQADTGSTLSGTSGLTASGKSYDSGFDGKCEDTQSQSKPVLAQADVEKHVSMSAGIIPSETVGVTNEEFDDGLQLEPNYSECADAIKGFVPYAVSEGSGSKLSSCNSLNMSIEDFTLEPGYAECADAIKTGTIKKISVSHEKLTDPPTSDKTVSNVELRSELYANPQILFRKRSRLLEHVEAEQPSSNFLLLSNRHSDVSKTNSYDSLSSDTSHQSHIEPPLEAPPLPARNYSLYLDNEEAKLEVPSPELNEGKAGIEDDDAFDSAESNCGELDTGESEPIVFSAKRHDERGEKCNRDDELNEDIYTDIENDVNCSVSCEEEMESIVIVKEEMIADSGRKSGKETCCSEEKSLDSVKELKSQLEDVNMNSDKLDDAVYRSGCETEAACTGMPNCCSNLSLNQGDVSIVDSAKSSATGSATLSHTHCCISHAATRILGMCCSDSNVVAEHCESQGPIHDENDSSDTGKPLETKASLDFDLIDSKCEDEHIGKSLDTQTESEYSKSSTQCEAQCNGTRTKNQTDTSGNNSFQLTVYENDTRKVLTITEKEEPSTIIEKRRSTKASRYRCLTCKCITCACSDTIRDSVKTDVKCATVDMVDTDTVSCKQNNGPTMLDDKCATNATDSANRNCVQKVKESNENDSACPIVKDRDVVKNINDNLSMNPDTPKISPVHRTFISHFSDDNKHNLHDASSHITTYQDGDSAAIPEKGHLLTLEKTEAGVCVDYNFGDSDTSSDGFVKTEDLPKLEIDESQWQNPHICDDLCCEITNQASEPNAHNDTLIKDLASDKKLLDTEMNNNSDRVTEANNENMRDDDAKCISSQLHWHNKGAVDAKCVNSVSSDHSETAKETCELYSRDHVSTGILEVAENHRDHCKADTKDIDTSEPSKITTKCDDSNTCKTVTSQHVGIVEEPGDSEKVSDHHSWNDQLPPLSEAMASSLYTDNEPVHMSFSELASLRDDGHGRGQSRQDRLSSRLSDNVFHDFASSSQNSFSESCKYSAIPDVSDSSSRSTNQLDPSIPPPRPPPPTYSTSDQGSSNSSKSNQSIGDTPPDDIQPFRFSSGGNQSDAADEDTPPAIPPKLRIMKQQQAVASIHRDFMESMKQLKDCGWYWGPLSWEEADMKLTNKPEGSFLVRDSSDERYILSLSFRHQDRVHHTRIEHHQGHFSFWSQPDSHGKSTIRDFVEQCVDNSRNGRFLYFIRPSGPGSPPLPVHLLHPVSRFIQMRSLQHMCRFRIVQLVRRDHIDCLPIPTRIKSYLKEAQYYVEYLDD